MTTTVTSYAYWSGDRKRLAVVEELLRAAGVTYQRGKVKRSERIQAFQIPPDVMNAIDARLAELD